MKAARTEHREAIEAETETGAPVVDDAEHRERLRLGSKAKVGGYLMARMQGRMPSGVEAEYSSPCGVRDGAVPNRADARDRKATSYERFLQRDDDHDGANGRG